MVTGGSESGMNPDIVGVLVGGGVGVAQGEGAGIYGLRRCLYVGG